MFAFRTPLTTINEDKEEVSLTMKTAVESKRPDTLSNIEIHKKLHDTSALLTDIEKLKLLDILSKRAVEERPSLSPTHAELDLELDPKQIELNMTVKRIQNDLAAVQAEQAACCRIL